MHQSSGSQSLSRLIPDPWWLQTDPRIHHLDYCVIVIVLHLLIISKKLKKENFMVPFYGWGSTSSKLQSHYKEASSWYLFDRIWNDEKLSQPWNHLLVWNMGPLDYQSSALTTKPLLPRPILAVLCCCLWLNL